MGKELSADSTRGWDGGVHAAVEKEPVRGGGRDHVCHCPPRRSPSGGQGPAAHGGNRESPDGATGHHPVAGVSRTGVRNHRGKGGVRLPRARRTGKVCTGNSTAAGTDHPLWQRTAFDKDHDGNGIRRHEGKKPAQQVAEFKIRVYGSHNM